MITSRKESVSKAIAQHAYQPQSKGFAQLTDLRVVRVDELAPEFGVLAGREVADSTHASARVCARVDYSHRRFMARKLVRRGQTRESGSCNHDMGPRHGIGWSNRSATPL